MTTQDMIINKTVPKGMAAVLPKLQAIELIILQMTNNSEGNNKAVTIIFEAHCFPPKLKINYFIEFFL